MVSPHDAYHQQLDPQYILMMRDFDGHTGQIIERTHKPHRTYSCKALMKLNDFVQSSRNKMQVSMGG